MNKTYEEVGNGRLGWEHTPGICLRYRKGWSLHREAEPAETEYTPTGKIFQKGWFLRGLRHRSGGPAVQTGRLPSYYLHGALQGGVRKIEGPR